MKILVTRQMILPLNWLFKMAIFCPGESPIPFIRSLYNLLYPNYLPLFYLVDPHFSHLNKKAWSSIIFQIPCCSCIVLWRVLSFSLGRTGTRKLTDILTVICWSISTCPSSKCPCPTLLGMGNSLMLPRVGAEVKGSGLFCSS